MAGWTSAGVDRLGDPVGADARQGDPTGADALSRQGDPEGADARS